MVSKLSGPKVQNKTIEHAATAKAWEREKSARLQAATEGKKAEPTEQARPPEWIADFSKFTNMDAPAKATSPKSSSPIGTARKKGGSDLQAAAKELNDLITKNNNSIEDMNFPTAGMHSLRVESGKLLVQIVKGAPRELVEKNAQRMLSARGITSFEITTEPAKPKTVSTKDTPSKLPPPVDHRPLIEAAFAKQFPNKQSASYEPDFSTLRFFKEGGGATGFFFKADKYTGGVAGNAKTGEVTITGQIQADGSIKLQMQPSE